ncbi:TadE/TadG family type IV pilus assembly protein [Salipiger marinus]|uniref:TadE/TadG family type IV pilus assembly protein n=1 Tax=Salipiger marinus TaxID=555512 RepID=UPI002C72F5E5|nr:TadE/TadG family type IV pilus assembly protein [Salipiger manganoxidans]MEB3419099.1 TadE/TadG family type IV pilus assembly protein [Salipiger manganoxidans]
MGHLVRHPKLGARPMVRAGTAALRDDRGVSAVEFALIAPMLVLSLLAMTDLGLAISERMTIGHILRAGAQGATHDIGVSAIDQILRTTAAQNMTLATAGTQGDDATLALDVGTLCSCAEEPDVAVACSTTCEGGTPTQIFYVLSAQKTYAGLLLPRFLQSKSIQVQVR